MKIAPSQIEVLLIRIHKPILASPYSYGKKWQPSPEHGPAGGWGLGAGKAGAVPAD